MGKEEGSFEQVFKSALCVGVIAVFLMSTFPFGVVYAKTNDGRTFGIFSEQKIYEYFNQRLPGSFKRT